MVCFIGPREEDVILVHHSEDDSDALIRVCPTDKL